MIIVEVMYIAESHTDNTRTIILVVLETYSNFEFNTEVDNSPMTGTYSEVLGMLSATRSWNTVNDSKTVMPSDSFSPASGGRMNTNNANMARMTDGSTKLNT